MTETPEYEIDCFRCMNNSKMNDPDAVKDRRVFCEAMAAGKAKIIHCRDGKLWCDEYHDAKGTGT